MAPKINVKERLTDGEIDLSMSDLEEVPVKEIAQLKKAYSLDLSNNRLAILPKNFPTLTHITKLDLSKNELTELPEDFGNLIKLRYLDLYQNKLHHLPLSFSQLKELKWLDLKDNPLVPTVAKIAGPCLDTKQCQRCAKDIVNFFVRLEQQVNSELESRNKTRQKQLEINQQKKQEEKKSKKKQKQKPEAVTVQKNDTNKEKSKKDNNKKVNKSASKKTESSSPVVKSTVKIFNVLLWTSIILFISTSVKLKLTENVELFTKGLYGKMLEALPDNYRNYAIQGGNVIHGVHEKTGNATLHVVKLLNDNVVSRHKCEEIIENLRNLFVFFITKIKEVYNQVIHAQ